MLYLVATPIGNLSDISFRAIEILKISDYILCEDTRHSTTLLRHYGIEKPLKSYHKFNETAKVATVIDDLKRGKIVSLISDAGTPTFSDPGEILVRHCIAENVSIQAIPGPCAAIQALSCSGFPSIPVQFLGFLKKKENELKKELIDILNYPGTTICYESPHRLVQTLTILKSLTPERAIVVARELTKKFEEFIRGSVSEVIEHWRNSLPKGEIVLLIGPPSEIKTAEWGALTPEEHVTIIEETYKITKKEAIKLVAQLRGLPKRELYKELNTSNEVC